ncbi:hypothetical protein KPH14_005087 [Odynerus spinipes]|uniref:Uncharacterized protein n=1 Tax=Odynerus spinipes TaxID=1348599 RepID=A0AAD9RL17_9HYME|nr:hypothetical protein KPH14_005087 [Odynerus spinipes]
MNVTWREDVTELKELTRVDYQQEFDFIARLREKFRVEDIKKDEEFIPSSLGNADVSLRNDNKRNGTYLRNGVNERESRSAVALNDELKQQISNVQSLDTVIRKFDNNVEEEMKETSMCQYNNRKKLREILSNKPTETGRLAENTRQFFNLSNEYANVPEAFTGAREKMKRTDLDKIVTPSYQRMSVERKISGAITDTNEKLTEKRQKANKFIKGNKTLGTYRSTMCPIDASEQQRITTLLRDTAIDGNNGIVNSSSNPYCVNNDERKLLQELNEKLSVLQTDIVHKSRKISRTQLNTKRSTNTCDKRASATNTAISTISTVSSISTLQNVDEAILMEVIEDSKMMIASSTDTDKRRQIIPFSKEI